MFLSTPAMRGVLSVVWLFAAAVMCAVSAQDTPGVGAPLGLRWGMSTADAEALGISLTPVPDSKEGVVMTARGLPKILSDAREVVLYFGFDDRLLGTLIVSEEWEHDDYGTVAKARFQDLAGLLAKKYGAPKVMDFEPHGSIYAETKRFASSLANKKRRVLRVWSLDDMTIRLALGAEFTSTFYALLYRYEPLYTIFEKEQKAREEDAL